MQSNRPNLQSLLRPRHIRGDPLSFNHGRANTEPIYTNPAGGVDESFQYLQYLTPTTVTSMARGVFA